MHVGLLTSPFHNQNLKSIAQWAAKAGFKALEVPVGADAHLNPADVLADNGRAVKGILKDAGIGISSLACYRNWEPRETYDQIMRDSILAAETLGVGVVCTFAGFPAPKKSKVQTLREVAPRVFEPLAREAEKCGVKIAFENWFETNLQNLECFRTAALALPQPNIGFNFDPSHLHWQGIDVVSMAEEFGARIFHTHAKDATLYREKASRLGPLATYQSFEFSIPGYGEVPWGPYIRALRKSQYDGVLSIEHEDGAFGVEEGFEKGLRFLSGLI